MNSLSWFIYLTQIVDNLSSAAGVILAIGGLLGIMCLIFLPMILDVMDDPPRKETIRSSVKAYLVVMGIALIVAVFIPDRKTMLLVAGSEMGERLVKSDSVNSIVDPGMDLIRKWIKQEADKIKDKS